MVFLCLHKAITTPKKPKTNDNTGTSNSGVYLSASSSKNTTYNQRQKKISQEHHEVFICMQTAITTPHITKITQQFTGTSNYGVYLYAYSDNNTPYKQANNITGTYGVYLSASSSKNTTYNQDYTISQEHQAMVFLCMHTAITTPHITTRQYNNITGTYDGVYLSAYSDNNTTYNQDYTTIHRNIRLWCWSGCIQQQKYHI